MAQRSHTHLHTRRPQIATVKTIAFIGTLLIFAVAGAIAFMSFIWLAAGATAGVGLMPWLTVFPVSLSVSFWMAWRLRL
ncbi:MAG: hypothetical protein ABF780_05805 [Bifidobacterium aquikefiri]|uniref:Uncharacterized protein n=2 Tax=Bifidobacterium aquikefiri TaxID=1653207 RepID=A0A261G271_9BIFI|nr:hypothetical protein [Bifidobacterium aquikefiri]OZG65522.1 hypothetical protein BAQU_1705 [Bifidobacterium aquikefiri]